MCTKPNFEAMWRKAKVIVFALTVVMLLSGTALKAQAPIRFKYHAAVPVTGLSGQLLADPWSGSLGVSQFDFIDFNGDGMKDLVALDRNDNRILTFLKVQRNGQYTYRYAPDYERIFPDDIRYWFLFRDYNGDGLLDLFFSTNGNVGVYRNIGTPLQPQFSLLSSILVADFGFGFPINIYVMNLDMPGIADLDRDGDLDILSFDNFFTGQINFFKNLSREKYNHSDSLEFKAESRCWGKFYEYSLNNGVLLLTDSNCNPTAASFRTPRVQHSGSSITLMDIDHDNDQDVLLGDVGFPNLVYLRNGGTIQEARMTYKDTLFPHYSTKIHNPIFPIASPVDVDEDGKTDLVVTNGDAFSSNRDNHIQYYRNIRGALPASDSFQLVSKNFLIDQHIRGWRRSVPAAGDLDNDGDQDMLIAFMNWENRAVLHFYRNTGTPQAPAFQLVDTNYLGLANGILFRDLVPCIADFDGDGDQDILLGERDGYVHLVRNVAPSGSAPQWAQPIMNYQNIYVGGRAAPEAFDVNNDGKRDLVIGNFAGILKYYRNTGTAVNPQFVLETDTFGRVNVATFSTGYSIPRIGYLNGNSRPDLVVGSEDGFVFVYPDFTSNLTGNFPLDTNLFRNGINGLDYKKRIGSYSAPALINLNGDTLTDLLVGFWRAGIQAFLNVANITTSTKEVNLEKWTVFPNPNADNNWNLSGLAGNPEDWTIGFYDLAGKLIQPFKSPDSNWNIRTSLSSGIYLLQARNTSGISQWQKVVVNDR